MPDEIDRQEFGRLQAEVGALRRDIDRMASTVDTMAETLDEVRQQLTEARGGWKMMMLMGGAGATLGAFLTKLLGKAPL